MMSAAPVALRSTAPRPTLGFLIVLPLLLSFAAPVAENAYAQEPATGDAPEDIWSEDYINMIFPWADPSDDILQFKQYHTYETLKTRMMRLAEDNPDIFEFHEGMNGGTNARGEEGDGQRLRRLVLRPFFAVDEDHTGRSGRRLQSLCWR